MHKKILDEQKKINNVSCGINIVYSTAFPVWKQVLYKEIKGVQKWNEDLANQRIDCIRGGRVEKNIVKLCWSAWGFVEGEEMGQLKGYVQKW